MAKRPDRPNGFTIIEVMIVLAIAALILLIVLLAVPALQRNSRNTSIRNAADTIVGGISEFASNNNGSRPTALTAADGSVELSGAAGTTPTTAKVPGNITVVKINFVPPNAIVQANSGYIGVRFEHSCDDAASTNPRATAVYYVIETSGANKLECADG